MIILRGLVIFSILCLFSLPAYGGQKFQINDEVGGEIGMWAQTWYQYYSDGKDIAGDVTTAAGKENVNDFSIRRAYFYIKAHAPKFSFFTHIASDRVGQEGVDNPSMGLGSSMAWRDLWITANLSEEFKIQVGRMYVPFTRAYGTTSTKAMLTLDLPFLQGGVRGGILYASKVGRDDGVTFWGNPLDGKIQYRLMFAEGIESSSNLDDHLRVAGRVSLNFFEAEKGWFNKGTYLGKKKVLAIGAGFDTQSDIVAGGKSDDHAKWTVDLFMDLPMEENSAWTLEGGYIKINHNTGTHNFSNIAGGDDAKSWYAQTGFLIPGGVVQPYVRYETISPDDGSAVGKKDTDFMGGGLNYYFRGHNGKLSLDYTKVNQEKESATLADHTLITVQLAFGF
jgi:hypothetical protein